MVGEDILPYVLLRLSIAGRPNEGKFRYEHIEEVLASFGVSDMAARHDWYRRLLDAGHIRQHSTIEHVLTDAGRALAESA